MKGTVSFGEYGIVDISPVDQDLTNRALQVELIDTRGHGGIALRITIH